MKTLFKLLILYLLFISVSCKQKSNETVEADPIPQTIKESYDLERIEPPNWWIGFKNPKLELLIKQCSIP